jgi:hypothetical protein
MRLALAISFTGEMLPDTGSRLKRAALGWKVPPLLIEEFADVGRPPHEQ